MGLAFKEDLKAKAYSTELRERVIDRVDEGLKPAEAAEQFDVSERTILNWLAFRKQSENVDRDNANQADLIYWKNIERKFFKVFKSILISRSHSESLNSNFPAVLSQCGKRSDVGASL